MQDAGREMDMLERGWMYDVLFYEKILDANVRKSFLSNDDAVAFCMINTCGQTVIVHNSGFLLESICCAIDQFELGQRSDCEWG